MKSDWISAKKRLPENGTIVEVKIARSTCKCGGYDFRECYFDNGFQGVKNQKLVMRWKVSPANDLIIDIDLRKSIVAKDCNMCLK